jgi:predicted membrane-bound spermidine synthase
VAWLFAFFFISGFCSILYELIWLRLAMAQFGVTTAMVSTVLSMFMAGLGLGSWAGGRLARRWHGSFPALRLYALMELLVGISAVAVPYELAWGCDMLRGLGFSTSFAFYLISGAWVGVSLVPWCACMGATIPLTMLAIRSSYQGEARRSFSYLYLANVLGATTGATLPLLLIEIFGFHGTLKIGAALNMSLAAGALAVTLRGPLATRSVPAEAPRALPVRTRSSPRLLVLLFGTGLCSMALEVVWMRQFTPYLGTEVYAFATILGIYLLTTYLGSQFYRRWSRTEQPLDELLWVMVGLAVLLPLFAADPSWMMRSGLRPVLGIAPFTGLLGFLTPMLVDRWSGGDPERAGAAYAVNVTGCILGPLVSGFVLLPLMNERWVTLIFAMPWFVVGMLPRLSGGISRAAPVLGRVAIAAVAFGVVYQSKGYEDIFPRRVVRRDCTATVIATGVGMTKNLFVNGVGITILTPVTKMMAHLPLAYLDHPPGSALVICFGMGTSYRSVMSWNIPTTAVELVPSVPGLFGYYHSDAPELLRSPLSHVVIDDGRRYLERTQQLYDVIIIDPPPPVQAAGSSLLYSEEFYATAKRRLRPGGILQQWLPNHDPILCASVTRALTLSFPYVRVFGSVEGWGYHFLASTRPIPERRAVELVERMPASARKDLLEWGPRRTAEEQFAVVQARELPPQRLQAGALLAPALQDDRPINEYYALRTFLRPYGWSELVWQGRRTPVAHAAAAPGP